jgi:deoxyribonuclease V
VALHHPHGPDCPCHRIVRSSGQLGRYIAGDTGAKARRLIAEGIEVRQDAVDLEMYGFDGFVSERPLTRLRLLQESLAAKAALRRRRRMPRLVGGVDVSYVGPNEGVAAYALVDAASRQLVWSISVRRRVAFPYISTYLAFRELPILLDLIEEVRKAERCCDVLLVDGSGMLHQRHTGIATHLGVVTSWPTVGVTKKLLCGDVDLTGLAPLESRRVRYRGRAIGVALRPTAGSRRPIFVSPGHRVDLAFCERLVRSLLAGRRLPEPLYWADRLSRSATRPAAP